MGIPDYQGIMMPLLKLAGDRKEHWTREAISTLAQTFKLSDEEVERLLPSGKIPIFYDRVHWALSYLKHSGLVIGTKRGYFQITDRGLKVLRENPSRIDARYLRQFPEFLEYIGANKDDKEETKSIVESMSVKTPEELFEDSYQAIRKNLANELLDQVKGCSPKFFEKLVVDLLVSMGYGGSREEAGKAIGRTGDEGIDGRINEDLLGLDVVYIQAKKWENTVGRPEIQKFAGALQGQKARKGIFITASSFSSDAKEYAKNLENKIRLIDGNELAEYMIEHDVGVAVEKPYIKKKIDSEYFEET